MWNLLSFLAGFALGWNHFRMYQRMVESLTSGPADAPIRRQALVLGLFRHFITFAAGILLIRVASFEPFHLCGGLFLASLVYRVTLFRRREKIEEAESR